MHPQIDVLIPTYKGFNFITDTLDSIRVQSYPNIKVLISIDGKDDNTYNLLTNWFGKNEDISHEIFHQHDRTGWIRNINFLLNYSSSDYLAILPHDDIILPEYYSQLYQSLLSHPNAIVSFTDIQGFGLYQKKVTQSAITGPKEDRVTDFITNHYVSVLFRGLIARNRVKAIPALRPNLINDFAADSIWGLDLILKGSAIRIPDVLYRKRYHAHNTHWEWNQWGLRKRIYAWTMHCKECFDILRDEYGISMAKELFNEAIMDRLFQKRKTLWSLPYYRINQELRVKMKNRVFNLK